MPLQHFAQNCDYDQSYFITLTYDNDHLPKSNNGYMSLSRKDARDYTHRLKRLCRAKKLMKPVYRLVGEYGSRFKRPHYHLILFGAKGYEFEQALESAWTTNGIPRGQVRIEAMRSTSQAISYASKYQAKQHRPIKHAREDWQREFTNVTHGLPDIYVAKMKDWHLTDIENRYYIPGKAGAKLPMPRSYADRIYTPEQKEIAVTAALLRRDKCMQYEAGKQGKEMDEILRNQTEYRNHVETYYFRKETKGRDNSGM